MIQIQKFSDLYKLFRVTSYVLRFVKAIPKRGSGPKRKCVEPDLEEMNRAEALWIKNCQNYVREDKKYQQLRISLGLIEDDEGILRCHGRIGNAPCPYETKYPAILAKGDPFTNLVIWASHNKVVHNGVNDTLAELRSRYWITQGRQVVKKKIRKCVTCKKIEGLKYNSAAPPNLPDFRVSDEMAFSRVGVDFAGPVYVRDVYSNKGKLVPDLSSIAFVNCLKRFIGRRGIPKLVVSDNAKTFKCSTFKAFLSRYNISWKFNVPRAPWWGGFFERLVRSVKRCLKKVMGSSKVNYEEFETLLVEVEGILNSRPLTYVSEEFLHSLTPSSLCVGRRLLD